MAALDMMHDVSARRPRLLDRMLADAPLFTRTGLLIAASLVVTLAAMALDPRVFQGDNIWVKPVKFQVALSAYLLTLAIYARWLPAGFAKRRAVRIFAGIVVACIAAELAWIGGAAANGTASHFNVATPAMSLIYGLMGVAALILTSTSLVWGVAIARNRATGLSRPVHLGLSLGLILTLPLTAVVAGYMSSAGSHLVGALPGTTRNLAFLGWSREAGDLRVAHFFAAHALHFVPAGAWAAAALLPDRAATRAVWGGAIAFVALVGMAFVQALAGRPFLPWLG